MSTPSRIVICGQTQHDAIGWAALAAEFNFELEFVPDVSALSRIADADTVSSVFVNFADQAETAAVLSSQVRRVLPNARLILSKPMASPLTPADLIDAGVFHSLSQPIHLGEMRQSLGFLWSALQQDAAENKKADSPATDVAAANESASIKTNVELAELGRSGSLT